VERPQLVSAIVAAITASIELPPDESTRTWNPAAAPSSEEDTDTLWNQFGTLAAAHAHYLQDSYRQRAEQVRGRLAADDFAKIRDGHGHHLKPQVMELLEHWQWTYEAGAPPAPLSDRPSADPGGWCTYGRLHLLHRKLHDLSVAAVAGPIDASKVAVLAMEKGKGKKTSRNFVAANSAALVEYLRIHGDNPKGFRPVPQPIPRSGWCYVAKLATSLRKEFFGTAAQFADEYNVDPDAVLASESGDIAKREAQILAIAQLLETELSCLATPVQSGSSPSSAPDQASASPPRPPSRRGGQLPGQQGPLAFRPGYPIRSTGRHSRSPSKF
jgi:hypothetical protein